MKGEHDKVSGNERKKERKEKKSRGGKSRELRNREICVGLER